MKGACSGAKDCDEVRNDKKPLRYRYAFAFFFVCVISVEGSVLLFFFWLFAKSASRFGLSLLQVFFSPSLLKKQEKKREKKNINETNISRVVGVERVEASRVKDQRWSPVT